MNQKDYELSIDYEMDVEERMYRQDWEDQHAYDDDELPEQAPRYMGNRKTKRASSFDDYLNEPPTKKLKTKANIQNEIKAELIHIRREVEEKIVIMKEEWRRIDNKIKTLSMEFKNSAIETWMSESSRPYLVDSPECDEDYYAYNN